VARPAEEASVRAAAGPPATAGGVWSSASDLWVPVLFVASGAAGLIYQVVWTQDLVLIFGDTTLAIVTTVTAFLAGLGIGSLVGAALGARLRRALAVYGLLEIVVGCLALLMPLAFDVIATLFRSAYLSLSPVQVGLIRFGLAFLALTPVTLLMGISLPVLTRHLVRGNPDVGERIARLYGLNTLGAVVGSAASGYLLIELLGLRGTTLIAVALNLCAGSGAVLISQSVGRSADRSEVEAVRKPERRGPLRPRQRLMLAVTFVSGLVSLALEVLWTRMMLQGTGSSIYVFVAVVAVFLTGIAGGSLVYERHKQHSPSVATLGALLAAAAALSLVPMVVSNLKGPPLLPLAAACILPVTAILGFTFPLTVRLFVDSAEEASRGVGLVYAANTAGCVAGTVLAGFVLIPAIGTSTAIIAVCLAQAVIGGGLALRYAPRTSWLPRLAGLAAMGVLLLTLFVPAAKLTYIQRQVALTKAPTAHFEDSVASVDVTGGAARKRNLFINGEGITKLTIDTKVLAYVPKAARPDATTMLNICFGMGSTYRSSIILGLRTTAVELDPTVPAVMSWFYPDASKYLHSPLGHVIVSDGRNYVRLSDKRYDLITVDLPPPTWSAAAVVLLTREFFQEARERLTAGGVLATFIPVEKPRFEKMILRTFRSEFRYMTVVYAPRPFGTYVLGSQAPINLTSSAIAKVFGSPAARADLSGAPDFKPVSTAAWTSLVHRSVWLTNDQVNAYAGAAPMITDDHPLTEYFLLHGSGEGFEPAALQLSLVVTALVALLIIGAAVDTLSQRRARRPA
jgi:spermidine synthase